MACWHISSRPDYFLGVSGSGLGKGKAKNSDVKEGVSGCSCCCMGSYQVEMHFCCNYSLIYMYQVSMTLRSVSGFIKFPIKLSSISLPYISLTLPMTTHWLTSITFSISITSSTCLMITPLSISLLHPPLEQVSQSSLGLQIFIFPPEWKRQAQMSRCQHMLPACNRINQAVSSRISKRVQREQQQCVFFRWIMAARTDYSGNYSWTTTFHCFHGTERRVWMDMIFISNQGCPSCSPLNYSKQCYACSLEGKAITFVITYPPVPPTDGSWVICPITTTRQYNALPTRLQRKSRGGEALLPIQVRGK